MIKKYIKFHISVIWLFLGVSLFAAEPIRIMPLGDSITYDNNYEDAVDPRPSGLRTAYRSHLYYLLSNQNITFDFVGSKIAGQDVQPPIDPNNEAYPGKDSDFMSSNIYDFLTANPADMILIHIGTNDHDNGNMTHMKSLLDEIDRFEANYNTPIRVILALIIQRQDVVDLTIDAFNNNLAELANNRINRGDNIIVVDMENDANLTSDDYADGTHPNDVGYGKMANLWVDPILDTRNDYLYFFPIKVVERDYIHYANIDETKNSVNFVASIPEQGMQF